MSKRFFPICFLLSLLLFGTAGAYEITFSGGRVDSGDGAFGIWPKDSQGKFCNFKVAPEDAGLVSVKIEGDDLVIDNQAYFNKYKTAKPIMVGVHGIKPDDFYVTPEGVKSPEKQNRMIVTGSADPAGCIVGLTILSNKGKAFWTGKAIQSSGKAEESFSMESEIPAGVESVWLRIDLRSSGIYRFKSVQFSASGTEEKNSGPANTNSTVSSSSGIESPQRKCGEGDIFCLPGSPFGEVRQRSSAKIGFTAIKRINSHDPKIHSCVLSFVLPVFRNRRGV